MPEQPNGEAVPAGYEHVFETQQGVGDGPQIMSMSEDLEIICGPLLNYQRMSNEGSNVFWHGSVLIVTKPGQKLPRLELRALGPYDSKATSSTNLPKLSVDGLKLYADTEKTFWRFTLRVPFADVEQRWEYSLQKAKFLSHSSNKTGTREFIIPAVTDSFRIMFHSCNGFSVGTDEDFWNGPALWNDVIRLHQKRPFHVMIGGGDQIYNDNVRVDGPLKAWTAMKNPEKRRKFPFENKMRAECDQFYYDNYIRWYSTEPFATANAQIPQVNIWDDHDIIDGFGSYTDHFMRCPVFRGIGGVAFKYYCLFQHHTAPPVSTFTTDAPQTMSATEKGTAGADARQLENTYIYKRTADDPSWIVGKKPGPYVEERSRNLYMRLGKRIAFCGIDARTERTRKQVNYPETYNMIFDRMEKEFQEAHGEIKHLILLLGVPIAYPRLAWLENILSSPVIAPLRLLNKRFGVAGDFFNKFDGSVDLLDDLDDHYTARHHKKERKELIVRLQKLAEKYAIRITILGGDVHLCAFGRFYSNPGEDIAAENDPRYIPNIVSSAITNKPPPKAVANLLAKRNKIHHLRDGSTDETLLEFFDKQPGGNAKGAEWNKATMPSRNYACITEIPDEDHPAPVFHETNGDEGPLTNGNVPDTGLSGKEKPKEYSRNGREPLHIGEAEAGTRHPAADGITNRGPCRGGLNIALRVEIDNHDPEGHTEGYGLTIPMLEIKKAGAPAGKTVSAATAA